MKNTLKTFKETLIPDTPYNWHIWKRAYTMGYKEAVKITNECRAACDWYSVGNQFNGHQQCRGCGKQKDF